MKERSEAFKDMVRFSLEEDMISDAEAVSFLVARGECTKPEAELMIAGWRTEK